MICTWRDCKQPAKHVCKSQTGDVWARLCVLHSEALDAAIDSGDPKKIMSCYIKAQGGSQKAAARMWGDHQQ